MTNRYAIGAFLFLGIGVGVLEIKYLFFPAITLYLCAAFPVYIIASIINLFINQSKLNHKVIWLWLLLLTINFSFGFLMNLRADSIAEKIIRTSYDFKKLNMHMPCDLSLTAQDATEIDLVNKKIKFGPKFIYGCQDNKFVFIYLGYLRASKSWNLDKLQFEDMPD